LGITRINITRGIANAGEKRLRIRPVKTAAADRMIQKIKDEIFLG